MTRRMFLVVDGVDTTSQVNRLSPFLFTRASNPVAIPKVGSPRRGCSVVSQLVRTQLGMAVILPCQHAGHGDGSVSLDARAV